MKKHSMTLATALLTFGLTVGISARAGHPCEKIREACKAAGFKKGDHKDKKGLMKDCVHPIMEGKTVEGVSVTTVDVDACKAKKDHHKS